MCRVGRGPGKSAADRLRFLASPCLGKGGKKKTVFSMQFSNFLFIKKFRAKLFKMSLEEKQVPCKGGYKEARKIPRNSF